MFGWSWADSRDAPARAVVTAAKCQRFKTTEVLSVPAGVLVQAQERGTPSPVMVVSEGEGGDTEASYGSS